MYLIYTYPDRIQNINILLAVAFDRSLYIILEVIKKLYYCIYDCFVII